MLKGAWLCWHRFPTSRLQNYKILNLCYFKPPSLWYFAMAALGNKYNSHSQFLRKLLGLLSLLSTTTQTNILSPAHGLSFGRNVKADLQLQSSCFGPILSFSIAIREKLEFTLFSVSGLVWMFWLWRHLTKHKDTNVTLPLEGIGTRNWKPCVPHSFPFLLQIFLLLYSTAPACNIILPGT